MDLKKKQTKKDDLDYIEYYYEGGPAVKEEYRNKAGELHRTDGPALVSYYPTGEIKLKMWSFNGKKRRRNGPSVIEYFKTGEISKKIWFFDDLEGGNKKPAVPPTPEEKKRMESYYRTLIREVEAANGPGNQREEHE